MSRRHTFVNETYNVTCSLTDITGLGDIDSSQLYFKRGSHRIDDSHVRIVDNSTIVYQQVATSEDLGRHTFWCRLKVGVPDKRLVGNVDIDIDCKYTYHPLLVIDCKYTYHPLLVVDLQSLSSMCPVLPE